MKEARHLGIALLALALGAATADAAESLIYSIKNNIGETLMLIRADSRKGTTKVYPLDGKKFPDNKYIGTLRKFGDEFALPSEVPEWVVQLSGAVDNKDTNIHAFLVGRTADFVSDWNYFNFVYNPSPANGQPNVTNQEAFLEGVEVKSPPVIWLTDGKSLEFNRSERKR